MTLKTFEFLLQVSDEYLSGLASRYASELGTDRLEVLQHLDNFRQMSNEKMVPEPTLSRCVIESQISPALSVHTYANLQLAEKFHSGSSSSRNFSPGIYAVSLHFLHCSSIRTHDL